MLLNAITNALVTRFMHDVVSNNMHKGNIWQNLSAHGPFMQSWKEEFRAHNFQVILKDFVNNTCIIELQINDTHGGVRCVFVDKDTSVREGIGFATPAPEGVSFEDYREHFHTVFGNSETPQGVWDLFPAEMLSHIDVAAALALLPVF